MADLVGEAAEQDEEFWSHSIWQEHESDEESFSEEEEKPDIFDSDFNDTESEDDSESDGELELKSKSKQVKKSNIYKDPTQDRKRMVPRKALSTEEYIEKNRQKKLELAKFSASNYQSRTIRDSTKAKSQSTDTSIMKRKKSPKKRKSHVLLVKTPFLQKDLLAEGLDTEDLNSKWLVNQSIYETEQNADKATKVTANASFIRRCSRRGTCDTILFSSVECMPPILRDTPRPVVHAPQLCVITGLPAKYRDPQTMLPYANVKAFKELRTRYKNEAPS